MCKSLNLGIDKLIKYKPLGYITKPFKESDIYFLLKKAESNKSNITDEYYHVTDNKSRVPVKFNDIIFVKADNVYVIIQTPDKKYLDRRTLKEFLELLPNYFIRVHRSYIINKNHIKKISATKVLIYNEYIPVSASYRENLDNL